MSMAVSKKSIETEGPARFLKLLVESSKELAKQFGTNLVRTPGKGLERQSEIAHFDGVAASKDDKQLLSNPVVITFHRIVGNLKLVLVLK